MEKAKPLFMRRGWDLNPRYNRLHTDFRDPHLKPLGHLSLHIYFITKFLKT